MPDFDALTKRGRRLRCLAASNHSIATDLCHEATWLGIYWELRRAQHLRLLQSGGYVYRRATGKSSEKYSAAKLSGGEWFAAADWLATRIAFSHHLSRNTADIEQVLALVIFQSAEQLEDLEGAGVC